MRMQMEENHALRVELLHARDLLGAELRARSRANGGSRPRRPPRSQLAAALQLAGTAREDSARLRRTEPPALWTL